MQTDNNNLKVLKMSDLDERILRKEYGFTLKLSARKLEEFLTLGTKYELPKEFAREI